MKNREIKLRAYCNIDKKMYPYALIGQNGALDVHVDEVHVGRWKNIGCGREDGEVDYSFELMQFTGLKDKNGKEIYEGDFVKSVSLYPKGGQSETIYEVVFEEDELRFALSSQSSIGNDKRTESFGWWIGNDWNKLEVIGNVFENHELLKQPGLHTVSE